MAMYEEQTDETFRPFHEMVEPGKSDRAYYAQVADGREWRVINNYAEKLVNATGLSSLRRVQQYRKLLTIPDDVWVEADSQDWTENYIRSTYFYTPPKNTNDRSSFSESFEQAPPKREFVHDFDDADEDDGRVYQAITNSYARDVMEDEAEELVSSPYPVEDLQRWVSDDQYEMLDALWAIIQLYMHDTMPPQVEWDQENLKYATIWFKTLNNQNAPKHERDLKLFENTVASHERTLKNVLQAIWFKLEQMSNEVVVRGQDNVKGGRK